MVTRSRPGAKTTGDWCMRHGIFACTNTTPPPIFQPSKVSMTGVELTAKVGLVTLALPGLTSGSEHFGRVDQRPHDALNSRARMCHATYEQRRGYTQGILTRHPACPADHRGVRLQAADSYRHTTILTVAMKDVDHFSPTVSVLSE
jgi:hypothetical protein